MDLGQTTLQPTMVTCDQELLRSALSAIESGISYTTYLMRCVPAVERHRVITAADIADMKRVRDQLRSALGWQASDPADPR